MPLHQAGMRGHDAHAKAIGTAFRRGDCSLVNVIAVSVRAASLIEERRRRIPNVTIINFAMVGFHSHTLWIDGAEMNSRRDFQRFTDQNALPIFIAYLNIRNFYRRPVLAYLRFPLAQMAWQRRSRRGRNSCMISRPECRVARCIPLPSAGC